MGPNSYWRPNNNIIDKKVPISEIECNLSESEPDSRIDQKLLFVHSDVHVIGKLLPMAFDFFRSAMIVIIIFGR